MKEVLIDALVVLVATASGASTGLGGGVVIKPVFDIVSHASTVTINFYSSLAVFVMAVITLSKQLRQKFKFKGKTLLLIAFGSIIGGFIGQKLLRLAVADISVPHVKVLQSAMLFIMLISVLIYNAIKKNLKSFQVKNQLLILVVGLFLGIFSVFLGIGGGPLNVAIMMLLFSFSLREAAVYSVGIIFFSQLTKMITIAVSSIKPNVNLSIVIVVIIAAVAGGLLGTWINRHASCKILNRIYSLLLVFLVGLTFFNTLHYAGIC